MKTDTFHQDTAWFESEIVAIREDCRRFAHSLTKGGTDGAHDAEDLVQFALIQAWIELNASKLREKERLKEFVFTTMRRRYLEVKRRHTLFQSFRESHQGGDVDAAASDHASSIDDLDGFIEEINVLHGLYPDRYIQYLCAVEACGARHDLVEKTLKITSNTARRYRSDIRRWGRGIKNTFFAFGCLFLLPRLFAFEQSVVARSRWQPGLWDAINGVFENDIKRYSRNDRQNDCVMRLKFVADAICPDFYSVFQDIRFIESEAISRVFSDVDMLLVRVSTEASDFGFPEARRGIEVCDELMSAAAIVVVRLGEEKHRWASAEAFWCNTCEKLYKAHNDLEWALKYDFMQREIELIRQNAK